jgi:hypothetical protein
MKNFDERNAEFINLLARSNRKIAIIRAALDGKSKTSVKRNPALKRRLQAA